MAAASSDLDDLEALLNQPVYAASKFAQAAADAPASVTVLVAGDIRTNGWRTLAEVLNGVRGVYLRNDRTYSYIGVRGFGRPGDFSSRLLVLIDGMRVNDNIYAQAGVGRDFPLDVGLIERVEFIPGPGSALYGSNAVLGVVNIVTRSAVSLRGGLVSVELGSASSRLVSLTQGLEFGESQLVLAAKAETRPGRDRYYAEFDAPETNQGIARKADRETDRKLYAKWTLGEFTAAALVSQRYKQIPSGAYGTSFPSQATSGTDSFGIADLQWQHTVDASQQVFVRTTLAQFDYAGRFDYGPADGLQHVDQRGHWVNVEARWQYGGWQGQRLVLGVEAQYNPMQRQRSHFEGGSAGVTADIDGSSQRWGLFATDEIALRPGLRAVLGARADRQLDGRQVATPRLALLWDAAPGLVVKLLDGRAYREPNDFEARYQDNTALANPNLHSETLRTSELALDWRALPSLRLAASVYRYKVTDLIEQQLDTASGLLIYNNVGAVSARGIELEADYVDSAGWRLRTSWSAQRALDERGKTQISNSPRSLGKLNLSVPIPLWHTRLGLEWQLVGERLALSGARLPAHAVANATLQFAPPGSRVSVAASVYNFFDKAYADPGGPELRQDTLAQDARQWRLQMTLQF
jgi:outer membrane cobalamin receptor